jgi:hypothetical protein
LAVSTYFILRSPYLPANRSICRLDAPSPLAWFQAVWPRLRQEADITSKALLDVDDLYYFKGFAEHVRSKELAAPADSAGLKTLLSENWYSNSVACQNGYVLVETVASGIEIAAADFRRQWSRRITGKEILFCLENLLADPPEREFDLVIVDWCSRRERQ